jgi:hypothetical protein
VTGGWGKPHNEELHNIHGSPNIIRVIKSRRMKWAGHVARVEEMRKIYTEGKTPLGKPRRRWKDNVKIDQFNWEGVDWVHLGQDRD